MGANLRVSIVNHLDSDAPGVSSQASNFPAANTKKKSRGTVWRATTSDTSPSPTSDQTFTYGWNHHLAANVFAVFGHNLAGGTIRLQLSSSGSPGEVYDSGALTVPAASGSTAGSNYGLGGSASAATPTDDLFGNVTPHWLYFPAFEFTAAVITFHTGPVSTAAGYIQAGRLWLGMYREAGRSADFGAQLSWLTNTQQSRTRGGSLRSNNGEVYRKLDLDLSAIPPADRAFWADVQRYSQTSKDLLIDVLPDDSGRDGRDHRFNGEVVALNSLVYEYHYRKTHLAIEEL